MAEPWPLISSAHSTQPQTTMFKFIAPLLACLGAVAASPAPASNGALGGPPDFTMFVV